MLGIKKRRGSLTAKFMFGFCAILLCVITLLSFFAYEYLKNIFIREAYEKTDIVLGHIDATMEYARDELRPQLFHILPGNVFIQQVMSNSFINKGIMNRFKQKFPRYIYRRVALDPMNPANKANTFEESFIRRFRNNAAAKKEWRGLVTRDGQDYFIHLKAVVMEGPCLLCHGDPAASPRSITKKYGKIHGRHWEVGDVVGLESISVPVTATFRLFRHVVLYFFIVGVAAMAWLFIALNYFHYKLAVVPLRRVSSFFKEVVGGHRGFDASFEGRDRDYDEVSDLAGSFNKMMGYLKQSEEERRTMEEQLLRADKLSSIGQLAAGVAHEINNPLSLILGYVKSLRKECPAELPARENLDIVYNNARLCKKIIEDLLSFSHQAKAKYIPVDVNDAADSVVTMFEENFRKDGIDIVRSYDPSLPHLLADETKLKLVFSNLLVNASHAVKSGGCVTVRTEFDRKENGIRVTFSDTGCGIPADIMDKIFEPFFTTKPVGEGTGLGLAVSRSIVREHDGEISVQSEAGAGASFTLWFPLEGDRT